MTGKEMTKSNNPKVFISYAWADELSALAIDQWLRNHGARVLLDRRDFIAGNDIEAEIVRCISEAGKVVCIYSKNSANRPYPELERRIAAALEREESNEGTTRHRRLIYFCIDDTPLPTEALPRLAIKATNIDFESACEELWRGVLEKSAPPKELDLTKFEDKPPWKMTMEEQESVGKAAWDAMHRIIEGQQSGSTLDRWKKETYEELTENIGLLPDDRKLDRIVKRLKEMVKQDEAWEGRNPRDNQYNTEHGLAAPDDKEDNATSMAARALSSAMFHGVMEDNRKLHRIRKELLDDVQTLIANGEAVDDILQHIKHVLSS